LSSLTDSLKNKFAELMRWERRKRREETLIRTLCAALALALVLAPLHVFLPASALRWLVPGILFAALAPFFFYRRRWSGLDGARAANSLDKTLGLEERAVTAWELAARDATSPAAQLVFQQAEEKLRAIEPRRLFPRRVGWPAYAALALFGLWFTVLLLDFDRRNDPASSGPRSLAQKAREFSRELQEKAKNEGLRETLKMGQELEKAARQGIDNKTADEQFKKELAGMSKKFDDAARSSGDKDSATAAESHQSLKDLQAELSAARDLAQLPDLPKGAEELGRQWAERLATMPQLKRQMDKPERAGQGSGQRDLKAFLDQLERQVSGELDRRALLDAQQYLQQMMKQGQAAEKSENYARSRAQGEEDSTADGAREKNPSNLPGKEPGKKNDETGSLPEFRADASTRVKGALGEGESSGLTFKSKPAPGKSAVSQSEVVASYRRQAEQELNSERVPEALKETIKNYFLSLGGGETKDK
jgi:predicted GNAT family N-acyltransferase